MISASEIRVLVVDDDRDQSAAVAMVLGDLGHTIVLAASGEEALVQLERGPFALVLLDMVMTGMDGVATAKRMQLLHRGAATPIVFLTGSSRGYSGALRAYSAGAVDFLKKPVDPVVLRSKVEVFAKLYRQRAELARHEERHRAMSELTTDYSATVLLTPRLRVVEASVALLRVIERSSDALDLVDWRALVAPDDLPRADAALARALAGGDVRVELGVTVAGRKLTLEVFANPIVDPATNAVVRVYVAARDRTAERRLEDELGQARKMEAIGRLAGGIAHDFNNMLTVISGNCSVLLDQATSESDIESLTDIGDAARRSTELTRQLLAFGRKQMLRPRRLDFNGIVESIVPMLTRLVGSGIRIQVHLESGLGPVTADPTQLDQVILNLVVNGRDAMPAGGEISIRTAAVELPEQPGGPPPGTYAELSVADSGGGMDAATRRQMFEPFFTTKDNGRGTGLGLATVDGIVGQSGGHIVVESELKRGTTFRVRFPMGEREKPVGDPLPVSAENKTILLVEAEPAIRKLTRTMLSTAGFTVLDVADGANAVALAGQAAVAIDLVVTNVVMPGMNGVELYTAVRDLQPNARVLYVSGSPDVGELGPFVEAPGTLFLEKPFTAVALCRAARVALEPRNSTGD